MDYTVIYTVPMAKSTKPAYVIEGRDCLSLIPINSVLASKVEDGSNVHIIIVDVSSSGIPDAYQVCKEESLAVLMGKECNVDVECITVPFDSTNETIGNIYRSLLSSVRKDSQILLDITFGPKYIPVLMMCLLEYSVRFLGCEVVSVLYGHAEFNEKREMTKAVLRDVTSVFLISSFGRFFGNDKEKYDKFLNGFIF